MIRLLIIIAVFTAFVSCKPDGEVSVGGSVQTRAEPTSQDVIDNLIRKKLLRVDINFFQVRSSPEFKDHEYVDWSDSKIACNLALHNFSTERLRLELELFTHYNWIKILRASDGEQVASLSPNPPRGVRPAEYFDLPAETSRTFDIQYEAFECFHGVRTEEGGVRYEFPGEFVIFHSRFPNDRLVFSVDESGLVRPKFDMKIQDCIEPKSEPDGGGQSATRPTTK